jgi:dienelactone hydrolase
LKYTLSSRRISGIPVLELYSEHAHENRPLVIMMHGLTARKENVLPYAYFVVQEGYHTVLFDAYEHGELETTRFHSYSNAQKNSHLYSIIFTSSKNIDTIIEAFADQHAVDHNRVGLIGFSMGGMMVYDYICRLRSPNVKAAVPIIATPAWQKSVRRNLAGDPEYAKYLDKEQILQIENRQPSNFLSTLKDFPLLILNGELDEIMPIEDIEEFYHQAKQHYTQKDLIRLMEYKGIGHTPTFEMALEAVAWLKRYL